MQDPETFRITKLMNLLYHVVLLPLIHCMIKFILYYNFFYLTEVLNRCNLLQQFDQGLIYSVKVKTYPRRTRRFLQGLLKASATRQATQDQKPDS